MILKRKHISVGILVSLWKNLLRTVKACDGHGELQERPNETPVEMFGTLVLLTIDGHWWWPFFIIFPSSGVARLGAWKWFLDLCPGSGIFFLLQMGWRVVAFPLVRGKIWRIWSSLNYCEAFSATVLLFTGSFCKLTMQVIDLCYIFVRVLGFKISNLTFFSPVCTYTWRLRIKRLEDLFGTWYKSAGGFLFFLTEEGIPASACRLDSKTTSFCVKHIFLDHVGTDDA